MGFSLGFSHGTEKYIWGAQWDDSTFTLGKPHGMTLYQWKVLWESRLGYAAIVGLIHETTHVTTCYQ